MKKYWRQLLTIVVMLFGIGTYYAHSAIVAASYPGFEIKTIDGDEKYIKPVIIRALYQTGSASEDLQITKDGHIYHGNLSFFEKLKSMPYSYKRRLRDKHGDFMRGVNYAGSNVYESEQYLVIADRNYEKHRGLLNQTIVVRWLDKQSGTSKKISLDVSGRHFMIHDVQMRSGEIIVFTRGWYNDENRKAVNKEEAFIFDMEKALFKDHETIVSVEGSSVNVSRLYEMVPWQPSNYVVYRKRAKADVVTARAPDAQLEQGNDQIRDQLYAYHVETGKVETIDLPESLHSGVANWFDGLHLYFAEIRPEHTVVRVFNIAERKVINELTLENGHFRSGRPELSVRDGLIYILDRKLDQDHNPNILVFSAETGEMVYRGEIVRQGAENRNDATRLDLHYLGFQY
jgi:hypothetical protein